MFPGNPGWKFDHPKNISDENRSGGVRYTDRLRAFSTRLLDFMLDIEGERYEYENECTDRNDLSR